MIAFSTLPHVGRLKVSGRSPRLLKGLRIYAIGDIHGRLDLLNDLLAWIETDIMERPVIRPVHVFLGDYIDRGSASCETVDQLIKRVETHECVFLKGNHEQIAIQCLRNPVLFEQWLRLGGIETLKSYGVSVQGPVNEKRIVELQAAFHQALPSTHLQFLRSLQSSITFSDFFFVHAGVKPAVDLSQQKESDLLWIREEFLSSRADFGKIVVHGHTPTPEVEVTTNRINIDTGAFATDRLTCLVIEDESLMFAMTSR